MRRKKFDLYLVIILFVITCGYFFYTRANGESSGIENYSTALETYKNNDYEKAYQEFGKIPSNSSLKPPALFRQARCATNLDKKENAIKKYKKVIRYKSKSSIVPISEYNMAVLMLDMKDKKAKKHFSNIIKKYPSSSYAIASNYYLGLIEKNNLPKKNQKRINKAKGKSLNYFKTYLEKAPDGRFVIEAINHIKELNLPLHNYDYLLIAHAYYANGEYEKARDYLNKTTLTESWSDFAKTEYKLGNREKANSYAKEGLKKYASNTEPNDVYEVIDGFISTFPSRKDGIKELVSYNLNSTGADYVAYLNCNEVVSSDVKDACYRTLYEKYPNGRFSADALYNLFMTKYLQKKYYDAQRLGFLHLKKFPNVKSSPAVTYYMGKIAFKLKHYENADNYFKQVIKKYPDNYYAYRAHYNLDKENGVLPFLELHPKSVVFPYKKSLDNNLVVKLAYLKDYDMVEELCKNDKFIQSWIAYEKGNYTISAVLARNAMEEMSVKPSFDDLRWRLVYPTHYYNIVEEVKGSNNPIILQSIIKEESHFNQFATSSVGAKGLMQLMPATYEEVVKKHNLPADLNSVRTNISAGSLYYASLKRALVNRDLYAISAYNGGIGSVTSWFTKILYNDTDEFVEQIPYPETKNYVKKIYRTYWMYGNLY